MAEFERLRTRYTNWEIEVSPFTDYPRFLHSRHWNRYDGALVYANHHEVFFGRPKVSVSAFSELGIPWINTSNRYAHPDNAETVPRVVPDDFGVGRTAGHFLRKKGCAHFLFIGFPEDFVYSMQRRAGFLEGVGIDAGSLLESPPGLFGTDRKRLLGTDTASEWVRDLPVGTGVFATNDEAAATFLRIARFVGRRVPEEFLVLGVDNDPFYSNRTRVGLSSIDLGSEGIGRVAARALLRWLSERERPPDVSAIPSTQIVERNSTDRAAVAHKGIARLLRRLRDHPAEPFDISEMARLAGLPRRTFHHKFLHLVGEPPQRYQLHLRLEEAMRLLRKTDATVSEVAFRSGFLDEKWFYKAFTRHVGQTPARYRKNLGLAQ